MNTCLEARESRASPGPSWPRGSRRSWPVCGAWTMRPPLVCSKLSTAIIRAAATRSSPCAMPSSRCSAARTKKTGRRGPGQLSKSSARAPTISLKGRIHHVNASLVVFWTLHVRFRSAAQQDVERAAEEGHGPAPAPDPRPGLEERIESQARGARSALPVAGVRSQGLEPGEHPHGGLPLLPRCHGQDDQGRLRLEWRGPEALARRPRNEDRRFAAFDGPAAGY